MPASDEINEQNIDKVLNYLRISHPDKATPEIAIHILEAMSVSAHKAVAHGEEVSLEEAVEKVLDSFDKNL